MVEPKSDFTELEWQQHKSTIASQKASQKDRLNELNKILKKYKFPTEEQSYLIDLMEELRVNRKIDKFVESAAVHKSHHDQVDDCKRLKREAGFIYSQLTFFKQFTRLDSVLRNQYEAMVAEDTKTTHQASENRRWETFRNRLHDDMEVLAKIASKAIVAMESQSAKISWPSKVWRDVSFHKLADFLDEHFSLPKTKRFDLALDLWTQYFPDNSFNDVQHAMKVIRMRHHEIQK